MDHELSGRVTALETEVGVPGLVVLAFDRGRHVDQSLGRALTDVEGDYHLGYDCAQRVEHARDLYVTVMTDAGRVLHTTEGVTRFDASPSEVIDVRIPAATIRDAGVELPATIELVDRRRLATLSCLDAADPDDALVPAIRADLSRGGTVFALMRRYAREPGGDGEEGGLRLAKLAKLFELGSVPEGLVGHHYGLVMDGASAGGGRITRAWGLVVGVTRAWAGKSFAPLAEGERRKITGTAIPDEVGVYRGANHFGRRGHAPVNLAARALLELMDQLDEASIESQLRYGHARSGHRFVAHRACSVHAGTPREVFRLNYRFGGLANYPPLSFLVEELVEIADGVYLGQQLLATRHLTRRYDPATPAHDHGYERFGYFLLFDQALNVAARRLFADIQMPLAAVTTRLSRPGEGVRTPRPPAKFTTLTLAEAPANVADPDALAQVERDVVDAGSVLRMLASYSAAAAHSPTTDSPVFAKLRALFQAGLAPESMTGYYDGAVVSWSSPGLLGGFGVNSLNLAWRVCRPYSPWTGQRFAPRGESPGRGVSSNQLCANTLVFRGLRARAVGLAMKAMKLRIEPASDTERREHGYDAKAWFAAAEPASSVDPDHRGKRVYQLNYRPRTLSNPPPASASIEELVQIARGLFLGQVNYATRPWLAWDPETDPASYGYRPFGYFVLLDREWQARRLRLGFDLHEV
ncbi:hypothetical protein ENSA5_41430 [Enhygromyxa salina]|uniref:Uncharacterized protein n=1 Tax=Enhygromyxa salina TaxID=215803 RepID=A0A2S9XMW7_9BACT|nr:hypothetical protein [Enhygromyxa salina]PRP94031.1 hypothetical protein ENSA5_41430 [Enhygromyxa salina]